MQILFRPICFGKKQLQQKQQQQQLHATENNKIGPIGPILTNSLLLGEMGKINI